MAAILGPVTTATKLFLEVNNNRRISVSASINTNTSVGNDKRSTGRKKAVYQPVDEYIFNRLMNTLEQNFKQCSKHIHTHTHIHTHQFLAIHNF